MDYANGINTISKDTDTTGEITITIDIPEEYQGHVNYSAAHVHNGQVFTVVGDINESGDAVTFKVNRFSTFALMFDDNEKVVISGAEPSVTLTETKAIVSSDIAARLYIAEYTGEGEALINVTAYDVAAETENAEYPLPQTFKYVKVMLWKNDGSMQPLCRAEKVIK